VLQASNVGVAACAGLAAAGRGSSSSRRGAPRAGHGAVSAQAGTIRADTHLELRVPLHPVGVVSVAAVVWPDAGLSVAHVPGLWPQHAQEGGGVHGACAHLCVVWEPHGAAYGCPVLLQPGDGLLEGGRVGVGGPMGQGGVGGVDWGTRSAGFCVRCCCVWWWWGFDAVLVLVVMVVVVVRLGRVV
jgi:hypothetical protein